MSRDSDSRCDAIRELLSAALDDALDASERATLDAHLADCPSCRSYQAELGELQAQLAAAIPRRAEVQGPRVLAEAMARQTRRRRVGRMQLAVAALAASLLVASAIVLFGGRRAEHGAERGSTLPAGGSGAHPDTPRSDEGRRDLRGQRRAWAPALVVSARGGGDDRARLWRVLVGTGIAEPLTTPPAGAVDRDPVVSPDAAQLLFVRQRGARRELRWRQRGGAAAGEVYAGSGRLSRPRFLCNRRLRALVVEQRGKRRSSNELSLSLPKLAAGSKNGRVISRRPTQLGRPTRSWSRDRCVRTELVAVDTAAGKTSRRVLSLAVSSCRGGRNAAGTFAKPHREVARWPRTIGNNVRDVRVSPNGRHVAVLLDRGPVGVDATKPASALLYLITLHDGEAARARSAAPEDPPIFVEGDDPGALSMKAQSRFLLWRRLAEGVLDHPRWSADGSQLCFLRRDAPGERGAWCFAPKRASSKRVAKGPKLRFAVPGPEGQRLALQRGGASDSAPAKLEVIDLRSGKGLKIDVDQLVADSAPAWLPPKSRGAPCAPTR